MKRLVTVTIFLATLSACAVDPQAAAERRANLIAKVFSNPADRQGLYLVFPFEKKGLYSSMLITHFEGEVSRAEVLKRVSRYCSNLGASWLTGQAKIASDIDTSPRTLPDGSVKATSGARYDCTEV